MTISEDMIAEVGKILLGAGLWWVALLVLLLGAVVIVLARRGVLQRLIRSIAVRPQEIVDEGGKQHQGTTLKVDDQGRVILPTDPDHPGGDPSSGGG